MAKIAAKQAYVEVAISGCGFLQAAKVATTRVAKAPKSFLAVESAGAFQRFGSQLLLIVSAGCVAVALVPLDDGAETSTVASLLLAFGGAWLVAESVLHPVSVVTTTILQCLLLDDRTCKEDYVPAPLRWLMQAPESSFAAHYP
mmetsp:Transcript_56379/g.150527  ORF Transcript_56379/g.150527 Transcript_56379/m.150527 type:complete len:144 (+) Transcript_56379:3-434(+)